MITVLVSGLPISAKEILKDAMMSAFGDVSLQELNRDNLRSMVRLSTRNVEIVLVVLDKVSEDICKDIARDLYTSDKYHGYKSDADLIGFLNNKYDLDIPMPAYEEVSIPGEGISSYQYDDAVSEYKEKLGIKDDIIANLEATIKDLTSFYETFDGESVEELETLRKEKISLSNKILDLESDVSSKDKKIDILNTSCKDLEKAISKLKEEKEKLDGSYESVVSELKELKITNSRLSGVLRSKENHIEDLESKNRAYMEELELVRKKCSGLEESSSSLKNDILSLRDEISKKEKEIKDYVSEIESLRNLKENEEKLVSANKTIDRLRSEISDLERDIRGYRRDINDRDSEISRIKGMLDDCKEEDDSKASKIESLEKRIQEDDETIAKLNSINIELQNKVSKSDASVVDVSSYTDKINDLSMKLREAQSSVFMKIGSMALPNSSVRCSILKGTGTLRNVRFAFAGSSESRKGAYKCLLEELRKSPQDKMHLIVDLVSETFVDYVFETRKVVPGIEWLRCGGSVQRFISNTSLRNVHVLSMGLGYINDSYFLTVDWARRLMELDNSGYSVIVFCGDVSNLVGRVLFDSFSEYGMSSIYVQGSAVCSRSIITNLRGLLNGNKSTIVYFDFNESSAGKFYNLVAKSYRTKIVSKK